MPHLILLPDIYQRGVLLSTCAIRRSHKGVAVQPIPPGNHNRAHEHDTMAEIDVWQTLRPLKIASAAEADESTSATLQSHPHTRLLQEVCSMQAGADAKWPTGAWLSQHSVISHALHRSFLAKINEGFQVAHAPKSSAI